MCAVWNCLIIVFLHTASNGHIVLGFRFYPSVIFGFVYLGLGCVLLFLTGLLVLLEKNRSIGRINLRLHGESRAAGDANLVSLSGWHVV